MLFVSHDRYFINRIATKVIELSPTGSRLFLGDYDYYLEKKKEEEEIAALLAAEENDTPAVISAGKENFQKGKEQQKLVRSLQRKVNDVEQTMSQTDATIDQLEAEMVKPEILADHVQLQELNEKLEAARSKQNELLEQWEELSLELEEYE